jgi:putative transcriptional regulator
VGIVVTLDIVLASRKVRSRELAAAVGITEQNLSLLKSGKVRGLRFNTLAGICAYLQCQPGDILKYVAQEGEADTHDADFTDALDN